MKYTSDIVGHTYVRILKDGDHIYAHEAADELNRLCSALEQIRLCHKAMIEKWEGIAAEATALAVDCPSREMRLAMERKAVHYTLCANDLRELIRD